MSISESEALHRRAIIVDGHCDTPYRLLRHNVHLDEHDPEAQADLRSLQESGITASFFAAYVPPFYADRGAADSRASSSRSFTRRRAGVPTRSRSAPTAPASAPRSATASSR